ncbi:hypothetical protein H9Q72_009374 [Fusarium xylarioides]|uniref:Uncharacterized protein n=1 Tax=Fusarium xylarioides TaxID=221167 RepID=A0A9P7IID4_9HYPO|nr:hypothetical protein H9Q72_009374 [Fusarium xylarioides]KAG5807908.1 hypothetical protein H9Q71_007517 [Fusarium xylarioides]KAG5825587.1 hypothetical protein H9Q74_004320 [Fusarium xylarioides]
MNANSNSAWQAEDLHHSAVSSAPKPIRVLACVHCQQRKTKCNRKFPCSNCLKAKVVCIPSTPAPARKKRWPKVVLQQRISKLEALLEQYTVSNSASQDSLSQAPDVAGLPQEASGASSGPSIDAPRRSSDEIVPSPRPVGKLVVQDGGWKFMDNYIWSTIHDNLQELRQIIESEASDEEDSLCCDSPRPDEDSDLLLAPMPSMHLDDIAPLPIQIFRLWQVFVERVNPLTKLIHRPTMENLVINAVANHTTVPDNHQALLFSIYLISVVSMTDEETETILNLNRDDAIRRFTRGAKVALTKVNLLINYDMVILQAFALYLMALQGRSNCHAVWVLSGVLVRIAHKMGLHRDGETLQLSPFETEMRRRVWWQIIVLDSMYATASGLKPTLLPSGSDTRIPHNINDTDFSPESTEIRSQDGPTEMVFCLTIFEIIHFLKDHPINDLEHIILRGQDVEPGTPEYITYNTSLNMLKAMLEELDTRLRKFEQQYCDPSAGPIHLLATTIRPNILRDVNSIAVPLQETPEWGTEVNNSQDNFFRIWLSHNETVLSLYDIACHGHFLLIHRCHFQLDSLLFLAGQLIDRSPVGSFADRAWRLLERFYHYHDELWNMTHRQHVQLARLILKAWDVRETAFLQLGTPADIPAFVLKLKTFILQAGSLAPSKKVIPPQSWAGGNERSQMDGIHLGQGVPNDVLWNLSLNGDWTLPNGDQSANNQNPVPPLFGFFDSYTGW